MEPCLGCSSCFLFSECGGIYDEGVWDCLSYCSCDEDKCVYVCPKNPKFLEFLRDTGGLSLSREWKIGQTASCGLPEYIPLIHHGSKREKELNASFVALPTFGVTQRRKPSKEMFSSAAELRSAFKIGTQTRIILSSIDQDEYLENYWRVKSVRGLAQRLSYLGVEHIISPNFSLPVGVPRFDNLSNIKRSLLCAEELSCAGLSVIPYLAGITQRDWQFWGDFLRDHTEISIVAKEFQTGGRNTSIAEWHISRLLQLQDHAKRGLHLIAFGARGYLKKFAGFAGVTLINSDPFMKTYYRFRFSPTGQWQQWPTMPEESLDDLLRVNVQRYIAVVRDELINAKKPITNKALIARMPKPAQLPLGFASVRISAGPSAQQTFPM